MLFVGVEPLYFNVLQRCCRQNPARQFEDFRQGSLVQQFIYSWTPYHPFHGKLWSHRWHEQGIAIFKPLQVRAYAVQKQIVGVYFLNKLLHGECPLHTARMRPVTPPAANSAFSGVESELMSSVPGSATSPTT